MIMLVPSIAVVALLAGPADDVAALKAADAALQDGIAKHDAAAIAAFYAEDAVLLPAAEPMLTGRAAIQREWEHVLAIPGFENTSTLTRVDVSRSGDLAYTSGTYLAVMTGEDGRPAREPGKWVTVWKKGPDRRWRIAVDIYNTDVKPPDHK